MAKETFLDKMAKKAFNSSAFQKSWSVHMQAFGPILEPAFSEDYPTRVKLAEALNLISKHDINTGFKKLQAISSKCQSDADSAAILFFMGVCCEMSQQQEGMLKYYSAANDYSHNFYLPYLKVAKFEMSAREYDDAVINFNSAIECLESGDTDAQTRLILGTAYANLANCFISMHSYDEAEYALSESRRACPAVPGREAAEAVLNAIKGDTEQLKISLNTLKAQAPGIYEAIKKKTDMILDRADPLFFPVPVDDAKIAGFWAWFMAHEAELIAKLDREEYESAVSEVAEQLLNTFPFLEETPFIALGKNEDGYIFELHDMYAVAVSEAYQKLLASPPAEFENSSSNFVLVH